MGTIINLEVEGVSLDWAKNGMGMNHGALFQEADRIHRTPDQTSHDNQGDDEAEGPSIADAAFVRPLSRVVSRLDLLGSTLAAARAEYESLIQDTEEIRDEVPSELISDNLMTFDEYCEFVCRFPLSALDDTFVDYKAEDRDWLRRGRFVGLEAEMSRLPVGAGSDSFWSEKSYFGAKVCVLSAYSMMQVLALCPNNADAEVVWQYGPMVESGWVDEESFTAGAPRGDEVLIVTEGSSDARILAHALRLLRPDISDFFRFIDVDLSHPFWGTGNLVKFAEGLLRIDVLNRILFVLDNDAEGIDALNRLKRLGLPSNIRGIALPDDDALRDFPALGPEGSRNSNINGRAAAIECYLDLRLDGYPPPRVTWTNYKKDLGVWHGALDHKETYMRAFLSQTLDGIRTGDYDVSKLERVIDLIVREAALLLKD